MPHPLYTKLGLHQAYRSTNQEEQIIMSNSRKPLWVKFIGTPGDIKTKLLENLTRNKDSKNLRCSDGDDAFYERVKNLTVTSVNYYTGIATDTMLVPSEIFSRLEQAFESIKLGIQNITMNDYDKNFDVIIEAQSLDELILYALTYRARNILTDFSLNLLMQKFHECREIVKKLQKNTLVIYLGDEPCVSKSRLAKRTPYYEADHIADTCYICTFYSIMLADFINRAGEKLMVQPGSSAINRLHYDFLAKILSITDDVDVMDLSYSPASPIYISSNTEIRIQFNDESEMKENGEEPEMNEDTEEPEKKKRKTEDK